MTRREFLCALTLGALWRTERAQAQDLPIVPGGGAAGGDALYLNDGDLIGVRNIQGGTLEDPNLDIGAGSTEHPGDVAVNFDVGRDLLVYDGSKRLVARMGRSGVRFYVRPRFPRLWRW